METAAKYEVMRPIEATIVNVENYAMPIESVIKQVKLIQELMSRVLQDGEHYGVIPGTKKPTLLKPGAEKLCLTFRLDPHYEIIREVRDKDWIAYTLKCSLIHIPSNQQIASGVGSCNSRETKYRYRYVEESTGQALPREYWKAKEKNDSKEMKRILGEGNRAAKIDGIWVIAKSTRIENDNPWDLDNTIIKMACKRALVAATLNATAASDIFTQDLEDMTPTEPMKAEEAPPPPQGQSNPPPATVQPKTLFEQLMAARGQFCKMVIENKDAILDFLPDELQAVKDRWMKASAQGLGGVGKGNPWPLNPAQAATSPVGEAQDKPHPPPPLVDFGETPEDDPLEPIRAQIREYKELLHPGMWQAIKIYYRSWESDKADVDTLNSMLKQCKEVLDRQNQR